MGPKMSTVEQVRKIRGRGENRNKAAPSAKLTFEAAEQTGPGTLAGRYLRMFWQPVLHSHDLVASQALPLRVMGESFTVFRGESGTPYVVAPNCPHRLAPLNIARVEGDELRCFYHGWKFNGQGQCIEQPSEQEPFCDRIRIAQYPTVEYIGLIFAWLGEGEPPPFPRYPGFEGDNVVLTYDSYERPCNYFNNLENLADFAHLPFAHHGLAGAWDERADPSTISATETKWGAELRCERRSGKGNIFQFGMPNITHVRALPDDPAVKYREFLAWWVPMDDRRHTQFTIVKTDRIPGATEGYLERRAARMAKRDIDPEKLAFDILAGKTRYSEVDPARTNMVVLQDHLAQVGVGQPSERPREHLGRSDIGVAALRRLWVRELTRLAQGEELKTWHYDPAALPIRSDF
jgi:5,5'-dehydrodivanillate O-demethylase